jgi:hypothetical protein
MTLPTNSSNFKLKPAGVPGLERIKPGKLNIAVVSDIHLGHRHNTAERIVANLMTAFPDNAETASLDIIFIAGDAFDDILMCNDVDVIWIDRFIVYLLRLCKKHGIELRVLEGTPGHDREQSERFRTLNELCQIDAPLQYVTELMIEHFPQFSIDVLYVPDEWLGSTDKALAQFKDLLRTKGLEKVDIAIMHGLFAFQLPPHVEAPKHNAEAYLSLVREKIYIGHDHTYKSYDRITVQGSFDRLTHGYESPKGHVRALWQHDGTWDQTFIENKNAMRFDTIDCTGLNLEETLAKIDRDTAELPEQSFVRVEGDSDNPIFSDMATLIRKRPLIEWTKLVRHKKEEDPAPLAEADFRYVPIIINRDNLAELVLERIANNGASGAIMDTAQSILEELFPWNRTNNNTVASTNGS